MLSRRRFLKFCDVVVSVGLGCSLMPFRLGVPPEIVLVTLGGGQHRR